MPQGFERRLKPIIWGYSLLSPQPSVSKIRIIINQIKIIFFRCLVFIQINTTIILIPLDSKSVFISTKTI
jgi:hypothetical protein